MINTNKVQHCLFIWIICRLLDVYINACTQREILIQETLVMQNDPMILEEPQVIISQR